MFQTSLTIVYYSYLRTINHYPLVNIALENGHWPFSSLIYPLKKVIFQSYVTVYQRVTMEYHYEVWGNHGFQPLKFWLNP